MKPTSTLEGLLADSSGIPPYTRCCLERAHQVALKLHAEELHPEHLLVALLADEDSAAGQAIVHAFADPETILSEVMALCPGILVIGSKRSLPFSVLGVRALEGSRDVARAAGAASIAPLHLLLASVASLDRELQRDLASLGLEEGLSPPDPSQTPVPEDGPLLKFFNNAARRAMAAACHQANRLGRDAIAPAHLMLGALEASEGSLAGLTTTRIQLFFNGRDNDSTPLAPRALPCSDEFIKLFHSLGEDAASPAILAWIVRLGSLEVRELLERQRVSSSLLEHTEGVFCDPEVELP